MLWRVHKFQQSLVDASSAHWHGKRVEHIDESISSLEQFDILGGVLIDAKGEKYNKYVIVNF